MHEHNAEGVHGRLRWSKHDSNREDILLKLLRKASASADAGLRSKVHAANELQGLLDVQVGPFTVSNNLSSGRR